MDSATNIKTRRGMGMCELAHTQIGFYGTRAGDIRQIPGRYEAYVDFGGESAVPLIADHPNLLVVQTMSKSRALAGLRVGYTLGGVGLIEALHRVKNSFNSYPLGRLAQVGATASVYDDAYFRESCARVVAGREAMTRELVRLGFVVLPSSANFVFARHPARGGPEFAAALREHAVLVRHFNKPRTA